MADSEGSAWIESCDDVEGFCGRDSEAMSMVDQLKMNPGL